MFPNPLFVIAFVCALHEQCTPTSMFEKKLKNTNFSLAKEVGVNFSRGWKSLTRRGNNRKC